MTALTLTHKPTKSGIRHITANKRGVHPWRVDLHVCQPHRSQICVLYLPITTIEEGQDVLRRAQPWLDVLAAATEHQLNEFLAQPTAKRRAWLLQPGLPSAAPQIPQPEKPRGNWKLDQMNRYQMKTGLRAQSTTATSKRRYKANTRIKDALVKTDRSIAPNLSRKAWRYDPDKAPRQAREDMPNERTTRTEVTITFRPSPEKGVPRSTNPLPPRMADMTSAAIRQAGIVALDLRRGGMTLGNVADCVRVHEEDIAELINLAKRGAL